MPADFSFNFEDEDIEGVSDAEQQSRHDLREAEDAHVGVEPEAHSLQNLLNDIPSQISYNTFSIARTNGTTLLLPRRELFDIRAQLMAEDPSSLEEPVAGLSSDDITPNVYEGGFKTWECSLDLAGYLLSQLEVNSCRIAQEINLIELGAGSALPTLAVFQYLLSRRPNPMPNSPMISLTVSDYNLSVLTLSTVPNLLLTWCAHRTLLHPQASGDLEVTPELCKEFIVDLQSRAIEIRVVSGSWGPPFVKLIPTFSLRNPGPPLPTIILASETIYSPDTLAIFTDALIGSVRAAENVGGTAVGLVAAKKVYFGVGGGVDEFLSVLQEKGGEAKVVWESDGPGITRVILEVRATRFWGKSNV